MDHQLPLPRNQQPETGNQGTVECLGKTFHNDDDRRQYFLEKLREKLKGPEFRKIEGFPSGSEEGILMLCDPAYRTARNRLQSRWVARRIAQWIESKAEVRSSCTANLCYSSSEII